ncbi:hypothetical protein SAMN05446589_10010 [Streptomyces sp. OV198]|nr:hypothetical protein BX281_0633 [Streptomyces sp. Ag82_O1-15]SOF02801.1 hypothetical protein SAMN05446589_10010 [Streptomyces sp. OV198]
MRDARHWADQIHRLNRLNWSSHTPVPHHADTAAGPEVHYTLPVPGPTVCESAVKDAIGRTQSAP